MKRFDWKKILLLGALGVMMSTPFARAQGEEEGDNDDVTHLPPAPADEEKKPDEEETGDAAPAARSAITIPSPTPYYIDSGVTMAPMRPLCDFLGIGVNVLDGILTLTQPIEETGKTKMITLRLGGKNAQISLGGAPQTVALGLPAETRLGNTFLPVRFIKESFGVVIGFRARDNALVVRDGERTGVLTSPVTPEYRGGNAATLTITNRVGRALSLRLSGPQSLILELGKNQSVTRRVKPGVYYYKAGSAGMKPRSGARRLPGGRRSNWSWGRK